VDRRGKYGLQRACLVEIWKSKPMIPNANSGLEIDAAEAVTSLEIIQAYLGAEDSMSFVLDLSHCRARNEQDEFLPITIYCCRIVS
jgi:hypothetical protein